MMRALRTSRPAIAELVLQQLNSADPDKDYLGDKSRIPPNFGPQPRCGKQAEYQAKPDSGHKQAGGSFLMCNIAIQSLASSYYKQSRTETDSNKHIYYKFPCQLEHHHKKVLLSKSQRSTLLMGSNADALKPFFDLLTNTEPGTAPAALDIPEGATDTSLSLSDFENLDLTVLDTLNLMCPHDAPPIPTSSNTPEMLATLLDVPQMMLNSSECIGDSTTVQQGLVVPSTIVPPPQSTATPHIVFQQTTLGTDESTSALFLQPSSISQPEPDTTKRCARLLRRLKAANKRQVASGLDEGQVTGLEHN
ncbi:hypothetical protein GGX14DRAFT_395522 [Mycena pura]|uniref:Uncharacterized protein n=1 Tax=Mycena pura TaxID=153505 RepID=A0AAD6Y9M7_9AGAR|nr:hypothetical protein GGX14DRAFT_395522 [Mycena pura]